jgi:hypothetical protein
MDREQMQRAEILKGWKDLGRMQKEDIGLLTDADEIFTLDFLRGVQVCDGIDGLDNNKRHCKPPNGLRASTPVFETSPECEMDGCSCDDFLDDITFALRISFRGKITHQRTKFIHFSFARFG